MALSRVNEWHDFYSSGTSVTVSLSGGVTANNLLIAGCTQRNTGGGEPTCSAGWTKIAGGSAPGGAGNPAGAFFYKIADGTETSVTLTADGTAEVAGYVVEYTGNATTSVLDGYSDNTPVSTTSGTQYYASSSLTPSQNDGMGFTQASTTRSTATVTCTVYSSYTKVLDYCANLTYDPQVAFAELIYSDGATQNVSWSINASSRYLWIGTAIFKAATAARNVSHLLCLGVG